MARRENPVGDAGGTGADLGDFGRFSDPSFFVLTSLAGGPKHGYALTKDIEAFAGVRLGPGTLYGALARLEERGLIESLPAEDRRHPYRITAAGVTVMRGYAAQLRRVSSESTARLRLLGA